MEFGLIVLLALVPLCWIASEFYHNTGLRISLGILSILAGMLVVYLGASIYRAYHYEFVDQTLFVVTDLIKKGERLNPLIRCNTHLGSAYRESGQYEAAINEFKKCNKNEPKNIIAHLALTGTYALAGRYEEARETWSEVKRLDPKMSVEKAFPKWWPYGPEHRERKIAAHHAAGIK